MTQNNEQHKPHVDPEIAIQSALSRTELWIQKNGKKLLIALAVVVLCIGGYFAYDQFVAKPAADRASIALNNAQELFAQDSISQALNGVGQTQGFLTIMDEYSGTPQANLAKHYAGMCYLYLGEPQKAIDMLAKYSTVKGALGEIVNAQNLGLTGDAYSDLGQYDKALDFYTQAYTKYTNDQTTPAYMHRAALVSIKLGKNAEALKLFQNIKNSYPGSLQARDVDKFIALANQNS